jgi:hypothetical protein
VGLEVEILPWVESNDAEGRCVISPLRYRLGWQDRMTAVDSQYDSSTCSLERVVREDGTWRLARIWREEESRQNREDLERARRVLREAAGR